MSPCHSGIRFGYSGAFLPFLSSPREKRKSRNSSCFWTNAAQIGGRELSVLPFARLLYRFYARDTRKFCRHTFDTHESEKYMYLYAVSRAHSSQLATPVRKRGLLQAQSRSISPKNGRFKREYSADLCASRRKFPSSNVPDLLVHEMVPIWKGPRNQRFLNINLANRKCNIRYVSHGCR